MMRLVILVALVVLMEIVEGGPFRRKSTPLPKFTLESTTHERPRVNEGPTPVPRTDRGGGGGRQQPNRKITAG